MSCPSGPCSDATAHDKIREILARGSTDHSCGLPPLLKLSSDGDPGLVFAPRTPPKTPGNPRPSVLSSSLDSTKPEAEYIPLMIPRSPYIPRVPEPQQITNSERESGGLVSKLDPRSWLEVLDPRHRYAKNLRSYYQAWDLLGEPMGDFWRWLDESDYELEVCPRALLERDTVHYCASQAEADGYALRIAPPESEKADATLRHADTGAPLDTGPNGWIFVLKGGVLYAAPKRTDPPRFHHSSFFAGRCVQVAGILVTDQERTGRLRKLFPHSGHYRPGDRHIQYILRFLQSACLDIASIEVDGQHTMKVARLLSREGGRVKKKERPYLVRGDQLLSFLEMKACSTPLFVELVNRVARDKKRGVSNSGQERRDHRGGRGAWAPETIHRSEGGSGGGVLVESSADTSVEVEAGELRGSSGEPSGEPSGRLGKELERGAEERRATLGRRNPLPPTPGLTPGRLGTSLEGSSFLRGGGGFMRTSSDNSLVSLEEHSPPGALATYPGVPGCEDDALEELAFGLDDLDDLAMAHHGAVPNGAGGQRLGSYAALEAP